MRIILSILDLLRRNPSYNTQLSLLLTVIVYKLRGLPSSGLATRLLRGRGLSEKFYSTIELIVVLKT